MDKKSALIYVWSLVFHMNGADGEGDFDAFFLVSLV